MKSYQPTVDKILALHTNHRGKVDVAGLNRYADRLQERAAAAALRGENHEADRLLELTYVHRAAAVQGASRRRLRWWRRRP